MTQQALTRRHLLGGTLGAAAIALLGAQPSRAQPATPGTPAPDTYAHPEWLAEATDDLGGRRFIALTPAADFAEAHIPGAQQVDYAALELIVTDNESAIAAWQEEVAGQLTEWGITPETPVTVYDGGTLYAVRLWWVLHLLGHRDVSLLNGGLPAWTAAGNPTEQGDASAAEPAPTPYAPQPILGAIATLPEVVAAHEQPGVVLVDSRSGDEYAAGHIPGAVNVPFTTLFEPEDPKRLLAPDALRELLAGVDVTPDSRVIPYCTTGVRSAAVYFAVRQTGHDDVQLFTGSFKEWSNHPELPIEK